jgi:hypothetical protein
MGDSGYPALRITRRTGAESFRIGGSPLPMTVQDFWCWYVSDLVSNSTRGVLAEFIVASALGIADGTRNEWDAYDLQTPSGIRVEVKSAAYLQSWYHRALSPIGFSIAPTKAWNRDTGTSAAASVRQADVYVLCVLAHMDKASLDPLDLAQWDFYVIATSVLNEKVPTQGTISLSALLKLGPTKCGFEALASTVEEIGRHARATSGAPLDQP